MAPNAAGERREYVLDAGADVLVTLLFLASEICISLFDEHIQHQPAITRLTIYAFQVGFAVAVFSHLCRILWHRTFLGPWCRWLWQRIRKGGRPDGPGGGPGSGYDGPGPSDPSGGLRPGPATRSPDRPEHTVLLHPEPGAAGQRAAESAVLGLLAAIFAFDYAAIGELPRQWSTVSGGVLAASVLYLLLSGTNLIAPVLAPRRAELAHAQVAEAHGELQLPVQAWRFLANPFGRGAGSASEAGWPALAQPNHPLGLPDRLILLAARYEWIVLAGLTVLVNVILILSTRQ